MRGRLVIKESESAVDPAVVVGDHLTVTSDQGTTASTFGLYLELTFGGEPYAIQQGDSNANPLALMAVGNRWLDDHDKLTPVNQRGWSTVEDGTAHMDITEKSTPRAAKVTST